MGNARVDAVAAGTINGGVGGSGGGLIDVLVNYNLFDEDFDSITGTGGIVMERLKENLPPQDLI